MAELEIYNGEGTPEQKELLYIWKTAVGLQKVDGLTVSDYLISVANKNINGEITMKEAHELIENHYKKLQKSLAKPKADVVDNVVEVLSFF